MATRSTHSNYHTVGSPLVPFLDASLFFLQSSISLFLEYKPVSGGGQGILMGQTQVFQPNDFSLSPLCN